MQPIYNDSKSKVGAGNVHGRVTFTGETVFVLADMFCCCHHLGASSEEEGGVVGLVQQRVQGMEDGDGKLSSFDLNWKNVLS